MHPHFISTLQIFPKHVIEFISLGGAASSAPGKTSSAGPAAAGGAGPLFGGADASNLVVAAPTSTLHIHTSGLVVAAPTAPPVSPHIADINRLARSHKDVSIMFMDIVGEQGRPGRHISHVCSEWWVGVLPAHTATSPSCSWTLSVSGWD